MDKLVEVCYAVARGMQILGAGVAVVCICIAGYQFMAGGRNGKEVGKGTIIGVVIGLVCIMGCEPLALWLKEMMTF